VTPAPSLRGHAAVTFSMPKTTPGCPGWHRRWPRPRRPRLSRPGRTWQRRQRDGAEDDESGHGQLDGQLGGQLGGGSLAGPAGQGGDARSGSASRCPRTARRAGAARAWPRPTGHPFSHPGHLGVGVLILGDRNARTAIGIPGRVHDDVRAVRKAGAIWPVVVVQLPRRAGEPDHADARGEPAGPVGVTRRGQPRLASPALAPPPRPRWAAPRRRRSSHSYGWS